MVRITGAKTMTKLRAKKPEVQPNRLRALIYGDKGVGKTHLACQFPYSYFIDTEGVDKYKKFVTMLRENNSDMATIYELNDIISEIKTLMTVDHDYKTLIIDSVTFPYAFLAQTEAERLIAKNTDKAKEGTEYSANLAKPKRLIFHLGTLLTRLDMNVIVLAHEKAKYLDGKEIGFDADIDKKMGHALGTQIHLRRMGTSVKGFLDKTRYDELPDRSLIDLTGGFEVFRELFGDEVFMRKAKIEELATEEQIVEIKRLVSLLNIEQDVIDKWFAKSNSMSFVTMPRDILQKCIDHLKQQINTGD